MPVLMHGGRKLLQWTENGGKATGFGALQRARLRWSALWFERYADVTARRFTTADLPGNLIFIIGLWRTGSTLLHGLLEERTKWNTPKTWQCFRPADFLLSSPPRERNVVRPMDEGRISTYSPQEDEFAALLLGEESLYRGFIDPRRLGELSQLLHKWRDTSGEPLLSKRWETFLSAVAYRRPGPLLLKCPNHTFRLRWLAHKFPDAQFIWLVRDARNALDSNRRMWTAMIQRYGLWDQDNAALEEFLAAAMKVHSDALDWATKALPSRLQLINFEELRGNKEKSVDRLIDVLHERGVPCDN